MRRTFTLHILLLGVLTLTCNVLLFDQTFQKQNYVKEHSYPFERRAKTTTDFFSNCSNENLSLKKDRCIYFYPFEFFHLGAGKKYLEMTNYDLGFNLSINYARVSCQKCNETIQEKICPDCTFIHIYKAGGTTMMKNMKQFKVPQCCLKQIVNAKYYNETDMKNFVHSSSLFAFVRDPVSKFIAACDQYTKYDSKSERVCMNNSLEAFKPSHYTDQIQLYNCFLDQLLKGNWINEHFIPMSYHLYFFTFHQFNIRVSVYPLEHMNFVLDHFRMSTFQRNARQNLFSEQSLPNSLLRKICTVYRIDTIMLKSFGIESALCTFH